MGCFLGSCTAKGWHLLLIARIPSAPPFVLSDCTGKVPCETESPTLRRKPHTLGSQNLYGTFIKLGRIQGACDTANFCSTQPIYFNIKTAREKIEPSQTLILLPVRPPSASASPVSSRYPSPARRMIQNLPALHQFRIIPTVGDQCEARSRECCSPVLSTMTHVLCSSPPVSLPLL